MPLRQAAGVLYVVTALVSGYWEVSLMLRPLIGGPWSWWYMIMLGASVLLLVGGASAIAPQFQDGWFVTLAAIVPLLLGVLFRHWSWVWLVFIVATVLVAWGALALASALQRGWVVALIASLLLAAWWVPASIRIFGAYLSPRPLGSPSTAELLWALTPVLLIVASVIVGVFVAKLPASGPLSGEGLRGEPVGHV